MAKAAQLCGQQVCVNDATRRAEENAAGATRLTAWRLAATATNAFSYQRRRRLLAAAHCRLDASSVADTAAVSAAATTATAGK